MNLNLNGGKFSSAVSEPARMLTRDANLPSNSRRSAGRRSSSITALILSIITLPAIATLHAQTASEDLTAGKTIQTEAQAPIHPVVQSCWLPRKPRTTPPSMRIDTA